MKKILLLIAAFLLISLFGCSDSRDKIGNKPVDDALRFKEEYEKLNNQKNTAGDNTYSVMNIDTDNPFKFVSESEIINLLTNDNGVIYFGYPGCPWCRNAVPVLEAAAKSTGLEKAYYLDVSDIRDKLVLDENNQIQTEKEGTKGYFKILEILDSILGDYILFTDLGEQINTGERRLLAPTVVFVRDGEIVGFHVSTLESQKDPYIPLNEDQKNELMQIYIENIKKVY